MKTISSFIILFADSGTKITQFTFNREKEKERKHSRLEKTDPTTSQQRNESEERRDLFITLLSFE